MKQGFEAAFMDLQEEYSHPCPNELRLIYDTSAGRFDAKYQYQPVLETEDLSFSDLFTSWI